MYAGRSNDRIAKLVCDRQCFVYRIGNFTACHLDAQRLHRLLELDTILASLNCIDLYANYLYAVLVQNTGSRQLGAQVQAGLTAQVRKQGIRTLFVNDLGQAINVQRLDISNIRCGRIGHDRSRVGINQHDLIAQLLQRLTRLCAGVVELTGLSDDNRAGADDEHFVNVFSFLHI